jgi:hypothetical protein
MPDPDKATAALHLAEAERLIDTMPKLVDLRRLTEIYVGTTALLVRDKNKLHPDSQFDVMSEVYPTLQHSFYAACHEKILRALRKVPEARFTKTLVLALLMSSLLNRVKEARGHANRLSTLMDLFDEADKEKSDVKEAL